MSGLWEASLTEATTSNYTGGEFKEMALFKYDFFGPYVNPNVWEILKTINVREYNVNLGAIALRFQNKEYVINCVLEFQGNVKHSSISLEQFRNVVCLCFKSHGWHVDVSKFYVDVHAIEQEKDGTFESVQKTSPVCSGSI
jgi:hypothetical protein